jgi:hypothetical protein
MTKEQRYQEVLDFKSALEVRINVEYLPLQKRMDKMIAEQNLSEYMELETKMVQLRSEIAGVYDELLRMRNELDKLFAK